MTSRSTRTAAPELRLAGDVLGNLAVHVDATGIVLGRDSADRPVLLRMFDAQPLTVAFIGGWWAAQVLVFRCLAHGARVVVEALDTATPARTGTVAGLAHWLTLDRTAGGTGDRVRPAAGAPPPASASRPLLRVRDLGPSGPASRPSQEAWHTQFTVLSRLSPATLQTVSGAHVVLVQRLEQQSAALVASALRLGHEVVSQLVSMDNDMVAAVRGGLIGYAWLTPTAIERQLFG